MRNLLSRLIKNRAFFPLCLFFCFLVLIFTLAVILSGAKIKEEVTAFGRFEFYPGDGGPESSSILVGLPEEKEIFRHWKVGDKLTLLVEGLEVAAEIEEFPAAPEESEDFLMVISPAALEKGERAALSGILRQGKRQRLRIVARTRSLLSLILNKKRIDLFT